MADAVIGALVQELFKILNNELNVYHEFRTQFDQLAKNLTPMTSFLIDAQKVNDHKGKKTVKDSLATLRETIYAADDILLDCQIRTGGILSPRELCFRYQTGKRLKEINMQINQMEMKLRTYLIPMMNQKNNGDESNHSSRWMTPLYNQSEMVGLSKDTELIKGWILRENEGLQQVGIVGMGGLGKTTLTRKIFNDKEVSNHFEKKIWVSVSQTYTVPQIMKSMLEQLAQDGERMLEQLKQDRERMLEQLAQDGERMLEQLKKDRERMLEQLTQEERMLEQLLKEIRQALSCTSDPGKLLEKIRQALKDKTYLIVMDDVWETEKGFGWWEQITRGLPKEEKHSCCIIITTRNAKVAESMGVAEERINRPQTLNKDESWSLFCKIAFNSSKVESKVRAQLEKVGNKIVEKCGGLPLAIITIGGLMSTKRKLNDWEKILEDFHGRLKDDGNYVLASLQLSYDELRPELKHCILCFSVYPEDYIISTEQLVHWWVGEGFVSGNDKKTAIQVASDYLSELFRRSLLEVVSHRGYDGRIFECKMHDIVRELIIKMAKEEAFCSFDDGCVQQFNSESRHLGLTSEIKTQSLLHQSNSKLRALLLTKHCPFIFSPKTGLANVNSLRVLDLSQRKLEGDYFIIDLLRWIKSQRRLAYLNLRGVARLEQVPKWIRKLRNLRILILADCCDLERLTPYIKTLPKLTVLDIQNCPSLQSLPKGLGNLSSLEELSGFKLAKQGEVIGCRLRDLERLSKLRVLRINLHEKDDIKDDELKVLSRLTNLHVLSIDTNDSKNEEFLKKVDQLVPPECLEELYLRKYSRNVTPEWLTPSKLQKLQYLCIEHAELTRKSPAFSDNKEQHWKILGLCLKHLPRLDLEWETVQTIMPELEYVEVSRCYKLLNFPLNATTFGFWRKI